MFLQLVSLHCEGLGMEFQGENIIFWCKEFKGGAFVLPGVDLSGMSLRASDEHAIGALFSVEEVQCNSV